MKRKIIALDPGGTTGWALWTDNMKDPREIKTGNMRDENHYDGEHHAMLEDFLEYEAQECYGSTNPVRFHVLCESFEFRLDERDRTKIEYISAEYIGVVKLWASKQPNYVTHERQSASQAKQFWTDEKLRRVGAYRVGPKHARDAMRHLLYYQTFTLGDHSVLHKLKPV